MSTTYDIPVIIIEVSGGVVQKVTADCDVNAKVVIMDHDNEKEEPGSGMNTWDPAIDPDYIADLTLKQARLKELRS